MPDLYLSKYCDTACIQRQQSAHAKRTTGLRTVAAASHSSPRQPRDPRFRFRWPPTRRGSEAAGRTRLRRDPVFVTGAVLTIPCGPLRKPKG
jgi:hypothetical protein